MSADDQLHRPRLQIVSRKVARKRGPKKQEIASSDDLRLGVCGGADSGLRFGVSETAPPPVRATPPRNAPVWRMAP
jgi:hypothetical protein